METEVDFREVEQSQAQAIIDIAKGLQDNPGDTQIVIVTAGNYLLKVSAVMLTTATKKETKEMSNVVFMICDGDLISTDHAMFETIGKGLLKYNPALARRILSGVKNMPSLVRNAFGSSLGVVLASMLMRKAVSDGLADLIKDNMPEKFKTLRDLYPNHQECMQRFISDLGEHFKTLRDLYPNRQERMQHFISDLGEHCDDCDIAEICPLLN